MCVFVCVITHQIKQTDQAHYIKEKTKEKFIFIKTYAEST